jgi:hypothetical protein
VTGAGTANIKQIKDICVFQAACEAFSGNQKLHFTTTLEVT